MADKIDDKNEEKKKKIKDGEIKSQKSKSVTKQKEKVKKEKEKQNTESGKLDNPPINLLYYSKGRKSSKKTEDYKYIIYDGDATFVGFFFADLFNATVYDFNVVLDIDYSDCIASREELKALAEKIEKIKKFSDECANKFSEDKFESDPEWYDALCESVLYVIPKLEYIDRFYNPDKKNKIGDAYYNDIYATNTRVLNTFREYTEKYLGVFRYRVADRGKFYRQYQDVDFKFYGKDIPNENVSSLCDGFLRTNVDKEGRRINVILQKEKVYVNENFKTSESKDKEKDDDLFSR